MARKIASLSFIVSLTLIACGDAGDDPALEDGTGDSGETAATSGNEDPGTSGDGDGDGDSGDGDGDSGDGDGDSGDGDGDGTGGSCEIEPVTPDEVVMIGDSYLAITEVPADLFDLARLYGALGANEEYRRYDQGGTQMGNGQIPAQFDQALAADPNISTVIMDGGGNDVLIGDANTCLQNPPPDPTCVARIDDVLTAAEDLLQHMADSGVTDVVYFFYPHLPDGGFVQGAKNETLDYAAPLVQEVCDNAPLNCVFVDPRPPFEGHPEYFMGDGIHPNGSGSIVLANTIWSSMVVNCIAQAQP